METDIINWSNKEVLDLLLRDNISNTIIEICRSHDVNGQCLLSFVDRDFYECPFHKLKLGERKRFILLVKKLQKHNRSAMFELGLYDDQQLFNPSTNINFLGTNLSHLSYNLHNKLPSDIYTRSEACVSTYTPDAKASRLRPEIWKTAIALGYVFLVTWVTAVVMVIVHDKVPDMKKYPPLPDLFLNNVPHIPWAFDMCDYKYRDRFNKNKKNFILGYVFLVTWVTAVVMVIVHDKVPDMKKYPPLPDLFLNNVPHIPWAFDMCDYKYRDRFNKNKKNFILGYVFLVTWVTAVVMVIVHDKVPDMKKYPPLPDLFLDNVPHIPWAFDMCEITGSFLMAIWVVVLVFHKHRFIILRRFFALAGTVFLLRCFTMLITSLSVPGSHLKCEPRSYPPADDLTVWGRRLHQAYDIWSGAGMSVRGVRTCGDYMFSGHTVALTLLNFFITEYTSRNLYLLHILSWVMNMFGIFFILAAHEHYSIDVFIAFYITSRLFLYYHTLSNNQALMQNDSSRTRIWFPLLSFFESEVDGIVPNEYESPMTVLHKLKLWGLQVAADVKHSSVAKVAGSKLQEGAAMGEYSVVKLVDGIKRNLSLVEEFNNKRQTLVTRDKHVQACLREELPDADLRHRQIPDLPLDPMLPDFAAEPILDFTNPPSPSIRKRFN